MEDEALRPARWFVMVDEDQEGPLTLVEVRRRVLDGDVDADTWVWADGMPDWMPAGDVPALTPPDDAAPA